VRRFEEPGSLFSIPLDANHFAVAQVVLSHGEGGGFGVVDAVFSRDALRRIDVDELRSMKRYRHVYTICGRRWRDLGLRAPIFPSMAAHYRRWRELTRPHGSELPGLYVVEKDPCHDEYERWTRVDRLPPDLDDYQRYNRVDVPEILEHELRERWGVVVPERASQPSRMAKACEALLESSAVAQVRGEAEREGPRWARRRLAMAARLALETTGYLDAEIGGPALAAACATRDAELARAFRSTTKTVKAAVERPKAVARRVLDPQTSELAELHRDAGTLKALEEYVEGLALVDTTR